MQQRNAALFVAIAVRGSLPAFLLPVCAVAATYTSDTECFWSPLMRRLGALPSQLAVRFRVHVERVGRGRGRRAVNGSVGAGGGSPAPAQGREVERERRQHIGSTRRRTTMGTTTRIYGTTRVRPRRSQTTWRQQTRRDAKASFGRQHRHGAT